MVAIDFLDEQKILLEGANQGVRYTDEELFVYLSNAYVLLQRDLPQFWETKSFETTEQTNTYYIDAEVIDGINLKIDGKELVKSSVDLFGKDSCESGYLLHANEITIKPTPTKDGHIVDFSFWKTKKLLSADSDIELSPSSIEPLRLLFLSRVFEKMPKVNDRDLSVHYLKRYQAEIAQEKRKTKQRHKFVTTKYKKV